MMAVASLALLALLFGRSANLRLEIGITSKLTYG